MSQGRLVLIGEEPERTCLTTVTDPSLPLVTGFVPVYPLVAGGLTNDKYNEVNAQISEIRPWLVYDLGRFWKRSILLLAVSRIIIKLIVPSMGINN